MKDETILMLKAIAENDNETVQKLLVKQNEQVRKYLLKLCTNNRKLKNFINKVFRENRGVEIYLDNDYGWEWDIECYGGDDGAEIAICNHNYKDDELDEDGWEMFNAHASFANYFDTFNWEDITLDNDKILLLVDYGDCLIFHIFDYEKMEDGKVDFYGITW
jgi:hypothetical protein